MDELVVISINDLKCLLREVIRQELALRPHQPQDEVLTSEEMLKMLKVSKGHLIKLRRMGLPHYYLGTGSGAIRYRRLAVMQYLESLKK